MTGDDEARPTSALSAMINARSSHQLNPAGSDASASSSRQPVYRPADLQPSDAGPTRRRNLLVSGTAQSASSMVPPVQAASYKRQGPYWNSGSGYSNYVTSGSVGNGFGTTTGGGRVLVPDSSSPGGGGFMTVGDEHLVANGRSGPSRSPYFPPSELPRNKAGSRDESEEDDSPRPKKRLVRSDDFKASSPVHITSPVDAPPMTIGDDEEDAEGEADESLPSVAAVFNSASTSSVLPPGLVSFASAAKGDDTPSSSVNVRLGQLNVTSAAPSSSASSRRPTPEEVEAATQAPVGPGIIRRKGKAKVSDSDEEDHGDDARMKDVAAVAAGNGDASSPPVQPRKKIVRRHIIPESPDVAAPPKSPIRIGSSPLSPLSPPAQSAGLQKPASTKPQAPAVVVAKLCELYSNVTPQRMQKLYDQAGGDVKKLTTLLHEAPGGAAGSSGATQTAFKVVRKPAQQHAHSISKHPLGSTVAAAAPAKKSEEPEVVEITKKKRKLVSKVESDDDDEFSGSDEDDDGPVVTEEEAVHFFNTCAESDMPGITACTLEQAKMVIKMRPFADAEDMRKKLRKKKGVSSAILDQYRDIMKGFIEVDRVLTRCERHGAELSDIMRIWTGASAAVASQSESTSLIGSSSDAPPPAAGDGGVHLVELSQKAVEDGTRPDAPANVRKAFDGFIKEQPEAVPKDIRLKPYQVLGINWLWLLYRKGISCILADEMGLGKTAQVIAFVAHLKSRNVEGPHLIIVPSSTLDNWMREFSVFAPSLSVHAYYGTQAERADLRYDLREMEDLDVVVTTYNIATSSLDDRKFLEKMGFQTAVYDEGHQLKNSESKKYKDLMRVRIPWRLLLTGTPLQNNLQELVSLLSFILPTIFKAARDDLRAIFKVPSDAQANLLHQQRITRAKKMMTPFVLRRKKVQVLQDLPRKIERVEYCDMSPVQRLVYRDALQRSRKALTGPNAAVEDAMLDDEEKPKKGKKTTTTKSGNMSKENSSANVLMELRKASNHPMLFRRLFDDKKIRTMAKDCLRELEFHDRNVDYIFEDMEIMTDFELHLFAKQYKALNKHALKKNEWMKAGKIDMLKRLLPDLKAQGDRILLFSQFTQILAILETVLKTMGIRYLLLTGSTPVNERQDLVDEFTRDEDITVFLLSTRAGGLGLNLMAANVVLIHDQDFNPHNDRQAEDRAYRLGQKRDVTVIKLITRGTIEEDIYQLAQTKIALDAQVSSTGEPLTANATTAAGADGELALPVGEGNEAATEKAVKLSLMAKLKQRAEEAAAVDDGAEEDAKKDAEGEGADADGEAAEEAADEGVEMNAS